MFETDLHTGIETARASGRTRAHTVLTAVLMAVVLGVVGTVAGLALVSRQSARLATEAVGGAPSVPVSAVREAPADRASREFTHPGPVLVPWKMILIPTESPEDELVVRGTVEAPEGVPAGQEITMLVYHSKADDLEHMAPCLDLPGFGTLPRSTRLASEVHYIISGPGFQETGFEIEFVRPPVVMESM